MVVRATTWHGQLKFLAMYHWPEVIESTNSSAPTDDTEEEKSVDRNFEQ